MIVSRNISDFIKSCADKYSIITINGPRQSGKTLLSKLLFADKKYITLEDPDSREFALQDPRGFLNSVGSCNVILDEIQNAPQLLSYIQGIVDQSDRTAQFILTGSQNFLMLEKISQSLAGRTAIITLLPFCYSELSHFNNKVKTPEDIIFFGGYPPIYHKNHNPSIWCKDYVMTYIERDVRKIINISDLLKFQVFLKLCAGRIGQLINFSSIATEVGVSYNTIKAWLSILEASYIIYLHKPHFQNFNKRLVKLPKLYFFDTAIACSLLGITKPAQIFSHYMKGQLFENFVIIELLKNRFNAGKNNNLYFWRDNHGKEIDIIIDNAQELASIEIKASQTFSENFLKNLKYWHALTGYRKGSVIYQGDKNYTYHEYDLLNWKNLQNL